MFALSHFFLTKLVSALSQNLLHPYGLLLFTRVTLTTFHDRLCIAFFLPTVHVCHIISYLSVCLSVYLSVCLSICLSVCLSVCRSVGLSVCRSVCLSNGMRDLIWIPVYISPPDLPTSLLTGELHSIVN